MRGGPGSTSCDRPTSKTEAKAESQEDAKRLFAVSESLSEESAMPALNAVLKGVGARRKTQVLFVAKKKEDRHDL